MKGNFDESVKSRKSPQLVIPAKVGIQSYQIHLDPGLRRGDDFWTFYRFINFSFDEDLELV